MSAIRAVTLDAAGTLIHVKEPVGETYARLARGHGIPVDAGELSRAFRTVFPRMSPLAFGRGGPGQLQRQERDWWRTLVRNCLGAQGQNPSFGAFFDELYGYYAAPEAWRLYPEIPDLLDALASAGIPAVVVSNFDTRLHEILDGLGISRRFQAVLCSSEVGAAKPAAGIFRAACNLLGVEPGGVLHAGDDRRADFEGARAAGLEALWLRRNAPADAAPDTIRDLGALSARVTGAG